MTTSVNTRLPQGCGGTYLVTDQVAGSLLSRADGLIPGALGAVRVVLLCRAGAGEGRTGDLCRCVGCPVLGLGLILASGALGLVTCAAGEVAEGVLDGARGGVDVGLEGGGVFRHDGCCFGLR